MRVISSLVILVLLSHSSLYSQVKIKHNLSRGNPIGAKYSADQTFMVIAERKALNLYMAGTTTLSREIAISKGQVLDFDMHPDNMHVLVVTTEGAFVYDYLSGKLVHEWNTKETIRKAVFLDGMRVGAISDKSLFIHDFQASVLKATKSEHTKDIRAIAATETKDYVVTGGGDGNLVVYGAATGETLWKRKVHDQWVRSIAFSPDGQTIASADDDGQIFLSSRNVDGKSKKLSKASGWITAMGFSSDSKFLAIGNDRGNISIYNVENGFLHSKLGNGSLLLSSLTFSRDGQELIATEEGRNVMVFNTVSLNIIAPFSLKNKKDINPPQILISNPPNLTDSKVIFYNDMIDLKGIVLDDAGVRSLKVNNIETPLKNNGNFVLYMPLSMGDNPVTIEAKDVNDNIALKKFIITRKNMNGENYEASKARNFLFVVGIDDYESWPKLSNAVKDAGDVTTTLMSKYGFGFDNLVILKNEQATRANIYKSLRSLIEKITPQDNLMIYYSGHGYFDQLLNEGYWIPVEAKTQSIGEYVSNSDILKLLENINSQHTFLVADACFSGALFASTKRGYTENVERFKSRWGLASGRLEVVSDGTAGTNSPFATAFMQFLNESTKEKFAVSELIQFVKLKVAETSEQTPMGNPLLVSGDEGGEFIFYRK